MHRLRWVTVLLILWVLFIIYGTTIPFDFRFDGATASQGWAHAQLRVFGFTGQHHVSRTDLVSNVLLFLPLGFLIFLNASRRDLVRLSSLLCALLGGFVLSLGVEILQLFSPLRTTSASDLFTNTMGAGLGAVAGWFWVSWGRRHALPWYEREAERHPYRLLAMVAVLAWLLAGALPFDFSLDVDDLKRAVKGARLVPFGSTFLGAPVNTHPLAWLADLARFSLLGGFLAWAAEHEKHLKTAALRVALAVVVSSLTALAVELGQLVVVSRGTDLTVVILACAGSLLGASWMQRRPNERSAALAGMVVWLLVLLAEGLAPFSWSLPHATDWEWQRWLPFFPYFQRLGFAALADFLREAGTGVPLGLLSFGVWPRRSPRRVGLIFFLVGLAVEAAQLFLPARTADLTDAISLGLGAAMGVLLAQVLAARTTGRGSASQTPVPSAKI
jgi:glycopeptide antibiotics resistance protein